MKTLGTHNYFVYFLTNKMKTVLYVGITNDLKSRLYWHQNQDPNSDHFTSRYNCFFLIYYELYWDVEQAIAREKQIKKYSRIKKENLINDFNPEWNFLNNEIE